MDDINTPVASEFGRLEVWARRCLQRSFTLTEMMVAVAVLLVVIIATSKIFSTASQITGVGQATASMLTEAAAIEERMRDDISKLTNEGFFAIRCVAVRNDVKQVGPPANPSAPLLDPNKPFNAFIRADQLVFFANGVESMQGFRQSELGNHKSQGIASRIYYGHAFQLPNAEGVAVPPGSGTIAHAHDPAGNDFFPWYSGNVGMMNSKFCTIGSSTEGPDGDDIFSNVGAFPAGPSSIRVTQPDCRQWLLARQAIALVDDDSANPNTNSKTVFQDIQTGRSIFLSGLPSGLSDPAIIPASSREVRNGRVNAVASQLDDIRQFITIINNTTGLPRPWRENPTTDQHDIISGAVYYPRAERTAPSAHRVDQALTNHVISSACSSFMIDWTYFNGTGHVDGNHDGDYADFVDLLGIVFPPNMIEQPWFGMPDCTTEITPSGPPNSFANRDPRRGTRPLYYGSDPIQDWPVQQNPTSIYFDNVDGSPYQIGTQPTAFAYEAFFGYNQTQPYWDTTITPPGSSTPGVPSGIPYEPTLSSRMLAGFTPWPSAIRVTMTLHDPDRKLEAGREFQFVIDLPKRTNVNR